MSNIWKKWKIFVILSVSFGSIKAGLVGMKYRPPYDCGSQVREAEVGKAILIETPNYPQKVSHGVNCVIKLKTDPGNKIIIKWTGFVVDGCHEGNKVRIVDGDQQQLHCGDKRPPTYLSSTHEVEIAISVVAMGRKDRGIIYRFTFEASQPRRVAGRRQPNGPNGKYLVSKYDESASYYDNQRIQPARQIIQTPQASQANKQLSNQQQGNQQGNQQMSNQQQGNQQQRDPAKAQQPKPQQNQQGNKQHLLPGQDQSPHFHQQAPQGGQQQLSNSQHTQRLLSPQLGIQTNIPLRKRIPSPNPEGRLRAYNYAVEYDMVEEIVYEADQEKQKISAWDEASPYIGLIGSIIAILIPIGILIKFGITWHHEREKNIVTFT